MTEQNPPTEIPSNDRELPERGIDLRLGASQLGIRMPVLIESRILERYAEIEFSLGLNVAGVILWALACHLAGGKATGPQEILTVCLLRRGDVRLVEVDLQIGSTRFAQRTWLFLQLAAEREAPRSESPLPLKATNL
jgi:hypothetical protein